ncbi:MAG: HAD hydrolase-like protein [Muribaculaceae bacterium]|nr:HAD hydrolase-like protein [Muribaculaceae bacterium]
MALIAFDLDDTLYKERDYVLSGRRAVAEAVAPSAGMDAAALLKLMNEAADAFDALADAIAATPAAATYSIERMVAVYRAHTPDISLDSAVPETLRRLRERGHSLALITDGNSNRQHAKIRALGLDAFFGPHNVIVSDDCGSDKTTTVPFIAAEALAPGERRVYVGDNIAKDFHWPNMRGWLTVMLRDPEGLNIRPQRPAEAPPAFRPAMTVDSLESLLSLTI